MIKKTVIRIFVLLSFVSIHACKEDPCKDKVCLNGGTCNKGTCVCSSDYTGSECETKKPCLFDTYSGSEFCNPGSYPVTSTKCCPSSTPYYCSSLNSCFATCEEAKASCGSSKIVKANLNVVYDGKCDYSYQKVTNPNTCGTGFCYINSTKCCPSDKPFYCAATTQCYATCQEAEFNCGTNLVYEGNCASAPCNYTQYQGNHNCSSGNYPVASGGKCCPLTNPWFCSQTGLCYSKCESASAVCSLPVYKAKLPASTTSNLIFYTRINFGCPKIQVAINSEVKEITSIWTSSVDPDCGESSCANFLLPAGTYTFMALTTGGSSCPYNWQKSVTVSSTGCTRINLF